MRKVCFVLLAVSLSWLSLTAAADPGQTVKSKALAHYIMGINHDFNGDIPTAIAEYEKASALDASQALPRLRLAGHYVRMGKLDPAISQLKTVLKTDPHNKQAHYLLALVYSAQKKYDLAAAEYEGILTNASKDNPENFEIYAYLAQLYYSQRKFDQAIVQFKRILALQPENVSAHFLLGSCYLELNNLVLAKESLKKTLTISPDHDGALNSLAYTYAQEGTNLDEALRMARHAIALDPSNGAYYDTLGWVLFKKGFNAEGLMALQKAAAQVQDPIIYDHMGDVYKAMKEFALARKYWKKSLEINPSLIHVQEKLDSLEKIQVRKEK